MPKINTQINLENFHFGDQFYGGFDWGFEVLRIGFKLILNKISLFSFAKKFLPKLPVFQIFHFQQIPIRGP